jgi:large subunit ribosomal protein L1
MAVIDAIKQLRNNSKKRNFSQTFDLIINLKDFDIKREKKLNEIFALPHGKGKKSKVVVFADTIKDLNATILNSKKIEEIAKNRREAKKLIRNTDFFLSEPPLMPIVGKHLGQILAPRGKMPTVITRDVKSMISELEKSIRIRTKDAPVIQCPVGTEDMPDEKIAENIEALIEFIITKLPRGRNNIGKILLKLTMSKPVRVEV